MSKRYAVSYSHFEVERFEDEAAAREFLAQNGGVLFEVDENPQVGVKAIADSQGDFKESPYIAVILMGVADVAKKTGKSEAWVKAKAAKLGCRKIGSTWVFTPSDVAAMEGWNV